MDTIDKIKLLCKNANTNISQLEKELGFSNGSLGKSKSIKADKLLLVANKFDVPMEVLVEEYDCDDDSFFKRIKYYQSKFSNHINTIAAHHDDVDWTSEELEEIENFKKYVLSKRNK